MLALLLFDTYVPRSTCSVFDSPHLTFDHPSSGRRRSPARSERARWHDLHSSPKNKKNKKKKAKKGMSCNNLKKNFNQKIGVFNFFAFPPIFFLSSAKVNNSRRGFPFLMDFSHQKRKEKKGMRCKSRPISNVLKEAVETLGSFSLSLSFEYFSFVK